MKKEVKLANSVSNKLFLISIKYSFHFLAFIYALNTGMQFFGIDEPTMGCFFHVSYFVWVILCALSYKLKYCYVHRLPLYYILMNETITNLDYYIGIPISISNILILHFLLIISLIFGYSYYHIKCKSNKR